MLTNSDKKNWVVIVALAWGAGVAICATTTSTYQVSASSDDGYAWSGAGQNISAGYLLVGDDNVYAAPYYMSAMRFNNVAVPRSAAIIDARLKIRSTAEEYRGQIYGVIQAEADDDAADFSSRYIGSAVKTATTVNWDHKFAWDINTQYTSSDISSIMQEVTDRPGWSSGNSAVVFYSTRTDSGKSRRFGSFDLGASYAAVLEVTYETYTISGYVTTSGGGGLSGVAVSAGVDIESAVTNASGYYQLRVPPGWSGTVAVDKPGWGFVPFSRPYSNVTSDQTGQNFTAFQPVISGHITEDGGAGVVGVTVSADNGGSDTTDATGYYEIIVPYDWSGTVTAGKTGWLLTPSGRSYSNVIADQANQGFAAFQPVISGHITEDWGAGVVGVAVSADNGGGSDMTDASGYYEIVVPYDWSGTVTVDKPDWGFIPFSRAYGNVTSDQTEQNFTAFQPVISGYVKDGSGTGIDGVVVSADNGGGSDTTDATGYYELVIPYDWSGTVTSTKIGWLLIPLNRLYDHVIEDRPNQDYTAFQPVISGYITEDGGAGVEGVIVSADNGGGSDTTDSSGYYGFFVPYDWSGQVSASKFKWEIMPENYSYANVTSDQIDQDFNAVYVGIIVKADGTGDFRTIQAAIDAVSSGDMIIVYPETYYENINLSGKDIIVISTDPNDPAVVAGTIIDGSGSGSVVTFLGTESENCVLAGFTITGGNADYYGGGLWGQGAGATITKCIISGNNTGWYGGGLYQCHGTISNCTISGNSADGRGGGLALCDATITGCTISDNSTGDYGGGLYDCDGSIINCTITNNSTNDLGGGLHSCGGAITNCTISGNSSGRGGGLYNCDGAITTCTISNNSASRGGGLYGCDGTITGCTISYNSAGGYGGGLFFCGAVVSDCSISDNSAGSYGGGLYNCGEVADCNITDNYAGNRGGGLYNCNSSITNCIISDNSAYSNSGGLGGCDGDVINCVISNNTAYTGSGITGCDGTIRGCTIYGNSATTVGGGVFGCKGTVTNCIIWANSPEQIDNGSLPTYSCVQDWTLEGEGNINSDPVFLVDGYHLSGLSPCIDAGDPNYVTDPNDTDIDSDPRVIGRIDIGADEFFSSGAALISLSPNKFQFAVLEDHSNPPPAVLLIRNHGQDNLNWSILADQSWLSAGPSAGVTAFGAESNVSVGVDTGGMSAANYSSTLTVTDPQAENSPMTVQVELEIIGPALSVSANEFNFQASKETLIAADQILSIVNETGGGTLNWQITIPPGCNWLTAYPMAGESIGEIDEVSLSIDVSGVDYGSYSCQLTVSDPNATNSPQIVTLNLDVLRPMISASPPSFNFLAEKGDPKVHEQTLYIQNTGYDTLNWEITVPGSCNWLDIYSLTGQSTGEVDEVVLSVEASGLDNAVYDCELTVADPNAENSPQTVFVSLHVFTPGEIHVPAEYPTIQAGIDAAFEGDHVIIHPGFHTSDNAIWFRGKAITVRSMDPADPSIVASTILTTQYQNSPLFIFEQQEQAESVLDGLTFKNCRQTPVTCRNSSPVVQNCVFENNFSSFGAAIIYLESSSAQIKNCTIRNNGLLRPKYYAGGIVISNWQDHEHRHPTIENCLISCNFNDEPHYAASIPGISIFGGSADIENCTIAYNYSSGNNLYHHLTSPGIFIRSAEVKISNSIIWGNQADDNSQIGIIVSDPHNPSDAKVDISWCDLQEGQEAVLIFPDTIAFGRYIQYQQLPDPNLIDPNMLTWGPGNIDTDPLFVREPNDGGDGWIDDPYTEEVDESANNIYGDCHLKPSSQCIDAGDPNYAADPNETDIDGEIRIVGGRIDMGADELQLQVVLDVDSLWMYQNLPDSTNSYLTATVSITDDPMDNASYAYDWEFILPDDVSISPVITNGGTLSDPFCTFAAPNCNESDGLSDSGQALAIKVTVTGDDYGNTAVSEASFGIALLGDVNNDRVVNVADRSIINAFWRSGAAGPFTFRDCDINCNEAVNVADRSIVNAVWRGVLGQNQVSSPCPLR